MPNTNEQEIDKFLNDVDILTCDFKPKEPNPNRCLYCGERQWSIGHIIKQRLLALMEKEKVNTQLKLINQITMGGKGGIEVFYQGIPLWRFKEQLEAKLKGKQHVEHE